MRELLSVISPGLSTDLTGWISSPVGRIAAMGRRATFRVVCPAAALRLIGEWTTPGPQGRMAGRRTELGCDHLLATSTRIRTGQVTVLAIRARPLRSRRIAMPACCTQSLGRCLGSLAGLSGPGGEGEP